MCESVRTCIGVYICVRGWVRMWCTGDCVCMCVSESENVCILCVHTRTYVDQCVDIRTCACIYIGMHLYGRCRDSRAGGITCHFKFD